MNHKLLATEEVGTVWGIDDDTCEPWQQRAEVVRRIVGSANVVLWVDADQLLFAYDLRLTRSSAPGTGDLVAK